MNNNILEAYTKCLAMKEQHYAHYEALLYTDPRSADVHYQKHVQFAEEAKRIKARLDEQLGAQTTDQTTTGSGYHTGLNGYHETPTPTHPHHIKNENDVTGFIGNKNISIPTEPTSSVTERTSFPKEVKLIPLEGCEFPPLCDVDVTYDEIIMGDYFKYAFQKRIGEMATSISNYNLENNTINIDQYPNIVCMLKKHALENEKDSCCGWFLQEVPIVATKNEIKQIASDNNVYRWLANNQVPEELDRLLVTLVNHALKYLADNNVVVDSCVGDWKELNTYVNSLEDVSLAKRTRLAIMSALNGFMLDPKSDLMSVVTRHNEKPGEDESYGIHNVMCFTGVVYLRYEKLPAEFGNVIDENDGCTVGPDGFPALYQILKESYASKPAEAEDTYRLEVVTDIGNYTAYYNDSTRLWVLGK